jgi:hypothetical protein
MNNNIIDIAIPLCLPCDDDTNNNNNNTLRHLSTLTPSSSSSSYGGGNTIGDGNRGSSGGGGCSPTPQNLRDNPERLAKVSTLLLYINYDIFHVSKVILVFSSHSPLFLSSPCIHSFHSHLLLIGENRNVSFLRREWCWSMPLWRQLYVLYVILFGGVCVCVGGRGRGRGGGD